MATLAEFKKMLDAMPKDKAAKLLSGLSESYGVRERGIQRQEERAEALEDTPTPGMRDAGVYKIASNPLEHLGAVGRRAVGTQRAGAAGEERETLAAGKQDALLTMMKEILSNQNQAKEAMSRQGGAPGGAPGAPGGGAPGRFGGGPGRGRGPAPGGGGGGFSGGGMPVGRGGVPGTGFGRSPFST